MKSHKDLEELRIRSDLHPKLEENGICLPATMHTLSKLEKQTFCKRLFYLKFPYGYGSNIGKCISIEDCKITCLKSHDYHILMQQLLSIAIRGLLPKGPQIVIFQLSTFFNELFQRVIDGTKFEEMENDFTGILCMFEMHFLPSFFDIMVHLTIHLGREVQRCGLVQYH